MTEVSRGKRRPPAKRVGAPASGKLEARVRKVITLDGPPTEQVSVYCPRRDMSLTLEECATCCHCLEVTRSADLLQSSVTCAMAMRDEGQVPAPTEGSIPSHELKTSVAQMMTRSVVCVKPEMTVEALNLVLVESGVGGVPVVDEAGHPVGIVSKTDLVWEGYDRAEAIEDNEPVEAPQQRQRVSDIMSRKVFVVRETASVAEAAALMAFEGIRRLPVVDRDGCVVGIVAALDIISWLARHAGYAVPKQTGASRA